MDERGRREVFAGEELINELTIGVWSMDAWTHGAELDLDA